MRLKRRGWKKTQREARVSVTGLESPHPCLRQAVPAVKAITRIARAPDPCNIDVRYLKMY